MGIIDKVRRNFASDDTRGPSAGTVSSFCTDLHSVNPLARAIDQCRIISQVTRLKCGLYGSLAATGKGHMTPQAVMMGLESSDPETVEYAQGTSLSGLRHRAADIVCLLLLTCNSPHTIGSRYEDILIQKKLQLGGTRQINFDMDRDMLWRNEPLPAHPNGMR
jgi:hypothetical protein